MSTIAFLGTGMIGRGFIEKLRERNVPVRAWNRTIERAQPLEAIGVVVVASAAQAVKGATRVHLSLSDDAAVDDVIASITDSVAPEAIVIDHTTTSPAGTEARARSLAARGIAFLHAPVFMAPDNARKATGMMLCSGPAAVFERAREALEAMTGEVWFMGEQRDRAAAFKLFGNAMIITMTAGLADVLSMAKATAIEPGDAMGLFAKFQLGGIVPGRGARMVRGDYNATFEATMARKDVRLMIETAERGGVPLAALPGIAARLDTLIAAGHGRDDLSVLAIDAVPRGGRKGA